MINNKTQIGDLVNGLSNAIGAQPNAGSLANVEKDGQFNYTFKSQASTNIENCLSAFFDGMKSLTLALLNNQAYNDDVFRKPFQNFKEFWTQSFYVRIFGYYLLDIVKIQKIPDNGISKSFTVKYCIDGKDKVLNFGSKISET